MLAANPNSYISQKPNLPAVALRIAQFALTLLLCAGLWFVRENEPGTTPLLPPCPFHELTDLHCPGCGSTRALHALTNGELLVALGHNVLLVTALPPLAFWYFLWLTPPTWFASLRGKQLPPWFMWTVFAFIAVFSVVRNLPWAPFRYLAP